MCVKKNCDRMSETVIESIPETIRVITTDGANNEIYTKDINRDIISQWVRPLCLELGLDLEIILMPDLSSEDVLRVMISKIRDLTSSLQTGRVLYKKLKEKREQDFDLILSFIASHRHNDL